MSLLLLSEDISAEKIKSMSSDEKKQLCAEIRSFLIETISKTGGHLASNLGTVELTVALHSVFDTPDDKIIFDVGHQCYTHKIITGRYKDFSSLRSRGGISGFPRSTESGHDAFIGGHSSISISAALGISKAMELDGRDGNVIAVIGDGALTGGEAFEGLNNVSKLSKNLIIVLNDNEMSISRSHGVVADYLTRLRNTRSYFDKKESVKEFLSHSAIGNDIKKSISGTKDLIKFAFYQSNIFESLGLKYYGPVNGHDIDKLIEIFNIAKLTKEPCIVHIKTKKGKGYIPAEENSGAYHGVARKTQKKRIIETYSDAMGAELIQLAEENSRVCAVTAAMKYATGLGLFSKKYPDRFFDVGIAEQHGMTFCCGLAAEGMIPVYAVYSTFLQRCYDQIIHDASIEPKHVVLCVDRAGLVGEDGETHNGTFDIPMLTTVPGITIYSPSDASGLRLCLRKAVLEDSGVTAVRYPRGTVSDSGRTEYSDFEYSGGNSETLVVSYGRISENIKNIENTDSLVLTRIYPIPDEAVRIASGYKKLFFFEETEKSGGIGEKMLLALNENGFSGRFFLTAIDNRFVAASDVDQQIEECGLDRGSILKKIQDNL